MYVLERKPPPSHDNHIPRWEAVLYTPDASVICETLEECVRAQVVAHPTEESHRTEYRITCRV